MLAHTLPAPRWTPRQDTPAWKCAAPLLLHSSLVKVQASAQCKGKAQACCCSMTTGAGGQGTQWASSVLNQQGNPSQEKQLLPCSSRASKCLRTGVGKVRGQCIKGMLALGLNHTALPEVPAADIDNSAARSMPTYG